MCRLVPRAVECPAEPAAHNSCIQREMCYEQRSALISFVIYEQKEGGSQTEAQVRILKNSTHRLAISHLSQYHRHSA